MKYVFIILVVLVLLIQLYQRGRLISEEKEDIGGVNFFCPSGQSGMYSTANLLKSKILWITIKRTVIFLSPNMKIDGCECVSGTATKYDLCKEYINYKDH